MINFHLHVYMLVWEIYSTKKHQNQNAERNFVSKISLKNYKCRQQTAHIATTTKICAHKNFIFGLYTESQNKVFFAAVAASLFVHCKILHPRMNFVFCILDCRHFYWKWKQIFLSQTTENENENMFLCSLCQNVCFCAFACEFYCCWI